MEQVLKIVIPVPLKADAHAHQQVQLIYLQYGNGFN